ncbi:phage baseplate assembly protein V [Streptomyces sp. H27-D2]|uniref:phage baseplate assembly protein V n=1 Tax=Streptomyces sp. H27-D2 TaxID=3046304 RepID=UPI002DB70C00|nr:phage baseplate assembly protein V [Streptomyces sp. H27-D2]MEC4018806.1 phage baseplate assembly protein V [Streptomyces sp. H27-D2]
MTLERIVAGLVEDTGRRCYGKYRGTVVDNEDPSRLGRLKLTVPDVFGPDLVTGWAAACVPYGGAADQGLLFVPERKAGVWVEFEQGDPEFPIWVGAYWSKKPGTGSQLPKPQADDGTEEKEVQASPTRKIIKTLKGHTIQFEDAAGKEAVLVREGSRGHVIRMDRDGISITDATGNALRLTADAVTLTAKTPLTIDAAGQSVTIVCAALDVKKG